MSGKKRSPYSNEQNYPLLLKKKVLAAFFLRKKMAKICLTKQIAMKHSKIKTLGVEKINFR